MDIVREKIYYLRNSLKTPQATVCVLKSSDGRVSRGLSLCSYCDVASKAEGRNKARGRAVKALVRNASTGETKRSVDSQFILSNLLQLAKALDDYEKFKYLSEFNPQLTEFEKGLLK